MLALSGGILLLVVSAVASPDALERVLTGQSNGALDWGPTLFRALAALHGLGLLWIGLVRDRAESPLAAQRAVDSERGSDWGLLAVILLVALGLRLWSLDTQLWLDEMATEVNYIRDRGAGYILGTYDSQNHHVLYTLLAWCSTTLLGHANWALRLPAVLFGVGSIALVYVLGRQLTTRREALLAAALTAVLYHHVWFCQNARGYTGMLFFTLLSSIYMLRGFRTGRRRDWVLYAIASALGAWVHMTMIFVVAGQFAVYLISLTGLFDVRPVRPLRPLVGFTWATLLTLLIYSVVLPQVFGGVMGQEFHEASQVKEWKNPLWTMMEFVAALRIGFAASVGGVAAVMLVGAGLLDYARQRSILIGLLFLPALFGAVVLLVSRHAIWPRFFYFTLGFGVLVIIRGAWVWSRWLSFGPLTPSRLGYAVCGLMIVMSAASLTLVYGPKQDYQSALRYIESQRGPDDQVATIGVARFCFQKYYRNDWTPIEDPQQLSSMLSNKGHTWVIYIFPMQVETELNGLWKLVHERFEQADVFPGTLRGGEIYVFRSRDDTARVKSDRSVGEQS